jgi:hypothetical protein
MFSCVSRETPLSYSGRGRSKYSLTGVPLVHTNLDARKERMDARHPLPMELWEGLMDLRTVNDMPEKNLWLK